MDIHAADEVNIAEELILGVGPAEHERTLVRRWEEATAELLDLDHPLPDAEQATLLNVQRRLHSLFIELWALREAAIREGVARASVDAALKSDPNGMALAHDLGNVAKHGPLTQPAMSPRKPTYGTLLAERPGSGGPWRFKLTIQHGPDARDGLVIARDALTGWERWLRQWNVL